MTTWRLYRNLQASLKDFLETQATADGLTDLEGDSITFRVGRKNDDNWTLSTVAFYFESETAPRFELGSNKRDDRQLIIIDIYAKNEADRLDLAKWVTDTINDGWRYYSYVGNAVNPNSPTATAGGWVNVDFVTNLRVNLGSNVDQFDRFRHRITINIWITE